MPEEDLAAASAMVEILRTATWDEIYKLGRGYNDTWGHLPYGGIPKGDLPTQPDSRTVPEATKIYIQATGVVESRLPEVDPHSDSTYAWTTATWAPMLWAIGDAAFAVATRSVLSAEDYDQLTAPWRAAFEG